MSGYRVVGRIDACGVDVPEPPTSAPPVVDVTSPAEEGPKSVDDMRFVDASMPFQNDPTSLLPSAGLLPTDRTTPSEEPWVYPLYNTTSLQPSNSVRSQRNWNEFHGHTVTPLPSPLLHTASEDCWILPTMEDSKTEAFFSTTAVRPPPKPPQNLGRSASSKVSHSNPSLSYREQRRQRALSSPNDPRERMGPDGHLSVTTSLATLSMDNRTAEPTELRPPPHRLTTTNTPRASRHNHGPSMSVTGDSLFPPPSTHTASDEADMHIADSSLNSISYEVLEAFDQITEHEDETAGTIGPYKIVSQLGTGAFSQVLLADPLAKRGSRVAVKLIASTPWKTDKRVRVSWVREAEILRHISHPGIVQFVSAFRTPQHYALALEALTGGELFDFLLQNQLAIARREWLVRRIFGELACVVHWMHSHNLVHRDIKLENIMLTRHLFTSENKLAPSDVGAMPLIKLTDFGLARFVKPNHMLETRCGSEEYAAPELILGKIYDGKKTDTWAMGVVLYALVTGAIPFLEPTVDEARTDANRLQQVRERDQPEGERDTQERRAHLVRIAKAEVHWPERSNENFEDAPSDDYLPGLRLVTPQARHIIMRFLRRDPTRRAECLELWKDPWFLYGSFAYGSGDVQAQLPQPYDEATMLCVANEASAQNMRIALPYCPIDPRGRRWEEIHTKAGSITDTPVISHDYS